MNEQLEALRRSAKVSRQQVASRLGVTYSMIQRIEEGHREMDPGFEEQYRAAVVEIAQERLAAATSEAAGAEKVAA